MSLERVTIPRMLKDCADKFGPYVALQMKAENGGYKKITYAELHAAVQDIGFFLLKNRINKGDRIALFCENRPEWPFVYFGITSIGAIVVPLDPKLESGEILNLLENSGALMAFCSDTLLSKLENIKARVPSLKEILNIDKDLEGILSSSYFDAMPVDRAEPDDIASIIYTSGTTGNPKGVMLSHKNILSNVVEIAPIFHMIGPGDNFLSVLPNYHAFETTAGMFCPIYLGATITYAESLKSYSLIKNMQETKVTVLCAVPLLYKLFLDGIKRQVEEKGGFARVLFALLFLLSRLSRLFRANIGRFLFGMVHRTFGGNIKFFVSGGAAIDPDIIKEFDLMGFTILQGYGLTETAPILSACTLDNNVFGSVGKALPGIEIKISNPNSRGIGEITAKGPNIMKGYYKNPEATAEILRNDWFYTGDLGRIDDKGNIYITGRSKDVIVLGSGVNVYPDEVEFILSKSPFIQEICVFGGSIRKGAKAGTEEVRAAVVPNIEKIADWVLKRNSHLTDDLISEILGKEIDSYGKLLTEYKRVSKYYVSREELPKTATKKIKRFRVKQTFKE
ncbi:MAG: AMP-binding protein [Candidatus Saganbacteria bacterium]|nr:AMP-binding protein [Candidatus Saganbacteria bacterium]